LHPFDESHRAPLNPKHPDPIVHFRFTDSTQYVARPPVVNRSSFGFFFSCLYSPPRATSLQVTISSSIESSPKVASFPSRPLPLAKNPGGKYDPQGLLRSSLVFLRYLGLFPLKGTPSSSAIAGGGLAAVFLLSTFSPLFLLSFPAHSLLSFLRLE